MILRLVLSDEAFLDELRLQLFDVGDGDGGGARAGSSIAGRRGFGDFMRGL